MTIRGLLASTALPLSTLGMLALPTLASAQVSVEDERNTTVRTSTAGDDGGAADVNIGTGGSIVITDPTLTGIVIDSDNSVTNNGRIQFENLDDVTAVDLQGGNTGDFLHNGSILLVEDFDQADTDDDNIEDTRFASGTGRTGILISGASPFVGNVEVSNTGSITVEGNDSYGIRLAQSSGLTGDLISNGVLSLTGDNNVGISVEGDIIGNLAVGGVVSTSGEGSSNVVVTGDIDGGVTFNGTMSNSGYRFTSRPGLAGRNLLDEDDFYQADSAVIISGNVSQGVNFGVVSSTDEDGNVTVTNRVNLSQLGGAPAILIDGDGTPIQIGIVAQVTDPDDDDFDEDLQYAFVNQGTLSASGVYDDINATVLEVRDASLAGGINNTRTMQASTFRSGDNGEADVNGNIGLARVIVLGSGAIADAINNSGTILASASEAGDAVYEDADNILAARNITAVAVDIEAGADLTSINNSGLIRAVIGGRTGQVYAIRDASGTLSNITNSGSIQAAALNSDPDGAADTDFLAVAIDASNNITGVTILQELPEDLDPDDAVSPTPPSIVGNILLGSGDDTIDIQAGLVAGDLAFGDGADSFALSGSSTYIGSISDTDGDLTIAVTDNSSLTFASADALNITEATIDGTSTIRPFIDEAANSVSTLSASGTITFEDGATVSPILQDVINGDTATFVIAEGSSVVIGGAVDELSGIESPYLYNTTYNATGTDLSVTFDLRSTQELGLDGVQTAAFESAYEALQNSDALGSAVVRLTNQTDFNAAYNQLLPEFAAAGRQFVMANVDGATGAVGSHLNNARRSQERPGGAWLEEFAYFADRSLAGLSEQYRGSGFGITGGFDTAWGPFHNVGLNLGFASTEVEDVLGQDDPMNVVTLQAGVYGGIQMGKAALDLYAGGGYNSYETRRSINIGSFGRDAEGDWDGTHFNTSASLGYDLGFGKYFVRPSATVSYLAINESGYTETGDDSVALIVQGRTYDSGNVTAAIDFGGEFKGKRTWMRPALRVGYRQELFDDSVITTGRFISGVTPFELTSEAFPDNGFVLGLTFAAGTRYSSVSLDYDADIRDGFQRHVARLVLRMLF